MTRQKVGLGIFWIAVIWMIVDLPPKGIPLVKLELPVF